MFKNVAIFSFTNIINLSGKLLHTEMAECLTPRDAHTVPTSLLQFKFFVVNHIRTGSYSCRR